MKIDCTGCSSLWITKELTYYEGNKKKSLVVIPEHGHCKKCGLFKIEKVVDKFLTKKKNCLGKTINMF